ncbi:intradiol ring-cleavage dioxygenase [Rothia sp. CCM 9417]|uniref:intradiol ring-cleavage dioxygenase n=1 Tax=Rothia sp. CCM 9417 TaxID=3402657 RepID=UPI003AD85FA7
MESHQKLTFEGRPLDRPGEDIEDQGLAFDLGTILDRRKALGLAGLGASAFVLAACSSENSTASSSASTSATTSSASPSASATATATYATEMPDETAGPYPGDGSNGQDVLKVTGVERSNITTSIGSTEKVAGVPLTLNLQVIDMANSNKPMANAAVYVWHCDAQGNYSMYSDGYTDQTWLRGVQVTDAEGKVTFESIVPGCYAGRWPHIHFEVFTSIDDIVDSTKAILTSQMAMPQEICDKVYALEAYSGSAANLAQITLETDNVFSDGWDMQLLPLTGSTDAGYTSDALPVPIDTTTAPAAGSMPGGAGAPPAGNPPAMPGANG